MRFATFLFGGLVLACPAYAQLLQGVTYDPAVPTLKTVLGHEPAVSSILEVVEEHRADLLVVGTRGLTGLKRLVLAASRRDSYGRRRARW